MNAETTMSDDLREDHILITNIPFVKRHRHAHQLESTVRKEWDANNIKELLLVVGIYTKHRVRVFRQVVCAVKLPQRGHRVHQAVVLIEPKVYRNTIESNL